MKPFLNWIFLATTLLATAQKSNQRSSTEIYHDLGKFNFLGTALYLAAHPDDENTSLISYLSNEVKANTYYLSLTRGDGGQNLIGTEFKELLGVLRTQELLEARKIDGGKQLFSSAIDFGFSKHPDETLEIWNKDSILNDLVTLFRKYQPDIVINRFDHRSPGSTHGHHTASAMLGLEVSRLASDPKIAPHSANEFGVWSPKRVFFNTSWWFYGSREKFEEADKSNLVAIDVGVYYPHLGISNNELASLARSQHKCQGFGQLLNRGSTIDYLELLEGAYPTDGNLFAGIDTSWNRVQGGAEIQQLLQPILDNFNFANPSVHLPELLKIYEKVSRLSDNHWRSLKLPQLEQIIWACSGIYLEANASTAIASPGQSVTINTEVTTRNASAIKLNKIVVNPINQTENINKQLENNKKNLLDVKVTLPQNFPNSTPYWLKEPSQKGNYIFKDVFLGEPDSPAPLEVTFHLEFFGLPFVTTLPVTYKYVKPEFGEIVEPFYVVPQLSLGFNEEVMVFENDEPKTLNLTVTAWSDNLSGTVALHLPEGWQMTKAQNHFDLSKSGEKAEISFEVKPSKGDYQGYIAASITHNGVINDKQVVLVDYEHIKKQHVLFPASVRVVKTEIKTIPRKVAYVMGAGDTLPDNLESIGHNVDLINPEDLSPEILGGYEVVIMGIRAYNVIEVLTYKQASLLDFVKAGGTMIVQYNTANRWGAQFENLAPYPLNISRDRITDENSPVSFLNANHPILNYPNALTLKDFEDWVQERGLYFPDQWDSKFIPLLRMNDPNENSIDGSLLVASYGKGFYVYTSLSFFRNLPAGVPGAYKLFSNLLALGSGKEK